MKLQSHLSAGLAPAIIAVGCMVSIGTGLWLRSEVIQDHEQEFSRLAGRIEAETRRRLSQPLYGLNGLRGLHAARTGVSRGDFRAWVASRDVDAEFPGVRGLGQIEPVAAGLRAAWVRQARADGAPDFAIKTLDPEPQALQYVIRYIEPLARNAAAVGLDVGSEPRRRAALERAVEQAAPALTLPVPLVQDGRQTPGFLLYVPVYEGVTAPPTVEQRRQRLRAVVYAPIVAREMLATTPSVASDRVAFTLHARVGDSEELVFESRSGLADEPLAATRADRRALLRAPALRADFRVDLHGVPFVLRVAPAPAFAAALDLRTPWLVTAVGLLLTGALAWVSVLGHRAQRRAERLAQSMTADLDRLAAVARHTFDAVVITGIDRRITWVNEGFERVTGYGKHEVIGRSPGELLQCEHTDAGEVARMRAALDGMQPFRGELVNRTKDGRDYWIELEIQPLRDAAGRVTGFMAVESDITHRKTALAQLQAARAEAQRLAMVARGTSNAVIITDRQLRIEWVNEAFTRLYGHPPEQAIGRTPADLLGSAHTAPEALDALRHAAERGDSCRVEVVNRHADGRLVWVDTEVQPRFDAQGRVDGFVEIQSDITARREADERLAALMRENAALLGTIREHAIVSVADAQGRIVEVNEAFCRISGYARDELLGKDHRIVNSGVQPKAFWASMWRTITGGRAWRGQICNRARDGSLYWVDSIVAPFFDAEGRIEKYVSIRSDITASKLATRQLAEQRQRLEHIVAGTQAGTWEHHFDTGELVINDLYASMLGHSRETWPGQPADAWNAMLHPDDLPTVRSRFNQHLHGLTREYQAEFRMRHRDGHWVWIHSRGMVSRRNARGEPEVVAGIHLDITERKIAEQELARSRERLTHIIDGTDVGTWEWNVETGQLVLDDRWAQIGGRTLAELGPTTIDTWQALIHPEDLSRSSVLLERHFNGELPAFACEARLRHRDGHWVWVLNRGKLYSRSADGRPLWMAGTQMDITERKLAEASLRESQALLDRTGRIGGIGGWIVELEPMTIRWSDQTCRLHEVEPGHQPSLEEATAYYPPEARPHIDAAVQRCIGHGESFDLELPLVTARGRRIWVRAMGEAEREGGRPEGCILRVVGAFQDITARRELSAALERQHQLLQTVIESLPCGLSAFDGERRLVLANRELGRLLDIPDPMLQAGTMTFDDLLRFNARRGEYGPVPDEAALEAVVAQRLGPVRGTVEPHQFERTRPDGTVIDVRGAPLPGGGWVTAYTDITARRRAEAEAKRSGDLLRHAIEAIDEAFVLFDPDDRLVMCNERYRQTYAHSADLIVPGTRFEDILRAGAERGQYEDAQGREDDWVAERMATHRAGSTLRIQRLHDGRTLRVVERRLDDGHIVGFRVDVTALERAREQAEAAGQQASEALARLRAIYDILPVGITITDKQGRVIDCNPASERLLGITRAGLTAGDGEACAWPVLREDGTPMAPEEFAGVRALRLGLPVHEALMQVQTPRGRVWLSASAMPAHHPELGVVVGYVDITDQRAQQAALIEAKAAAEQASVAKGQFLANMSHEIRTPMNAILGMLALLRRTELPPRQADYAVKAESAAQSLLGLLNDILDFSKVEAGKMVLDVQPFRLDQLLRDLGVILSASVGDKPLEVLFDIDPGLPDWLHGDAPRLQQVLINLGGNAIKFTPQGEVVVSVQQQGEDEQGVLMRFAVRDTGIGIAPEHQARIFDGFNQAEASITRRYGGTGLGLAISQRLVALMGGRLELESEPGQGACFSFNVRLPRAQADADAPQPLTMRRALVVDDTPAARRVLQRQCEALHWTADVVEDGARALERLAAARRAGVPYDVLLIDWQMPGLDGFDTLRRVQAEGLRDATTVVMMVSAHGRDRLDRQPDKDRALLDAYLVKPVTASMLLDAVVDAGSGPDRAPRPQRVRPPQAGRRLLGLRLLLVEDNRNNQQVASELLADEGATVSLASHGGEAVEAVAAADPPFDLVLMDLQMPVMDGLTATGRIRQDLGKVTLPIVAMTANAMASDRDACLAAGMNDHVAKPFDIESLVRVILRLCGRQVDGAAAPVAVAALPADVARLAEQAGIELDAALRRMGGNATVLRRLLDDFLRDGTALVTQADAALAQGRLADAGRALHTLKGLAATLGIDALAARAAAAEKGLGHAPASAPPAHLVEAVAGELSRTQQALPALLMAWGTAAAAPAPTSEPPAALDRAALVADLDGLRRLLADSDMAALGAAQALAERHAASAGPRLESLLHVVNGLAFDGAQALVEAWMKEMTA